MKVGNLALRVITVAPLIPLLILAIEWSRPHAVWGIVYAATLVALVEYFGITLDDETDRRFGIVVGMGLAALAYWGGAAASIVLPAIVIVPAVYFLFRFRDLQTVVQRAALTTLGLVY